MSVPTCPYARVECVLPSSLSDSPATCKSSCFMIVLAIDVDYFICKGCKRPVEEHKCIESHTFIMSLLSPVTVDHLKYSLNCERFVELQLYC